jgi:hypothetical protein
MSAKTFVDTNVLICAHDADVRSKYEIAQAALRALWEDGTGLLSPQSPRILCECDPQNRKAAQSNSGTVRREHVPSGASNSTQPM